MVFEDVSINVSPTLKKSEVMFQRARVSFLIGGWYGDVLLLEKQHASSEVGYGWVGESLNQQNCEVYETI